jgi:hypothetical protein
VTRFFTPAEASATPLFVSRNDLEPVLSLCNIILTIAQSLRFLGVGGRLTVLFSCIFYLIGVFFILAIPGHMLVAEYERGVCVTQIA